MVGREDPSVLRTLALAVAVATAGPAAVTDLGTLPGGSAGTVFAMTGDIAVGTSSTSTAFQRAFLHDAGGMHDLGGFGELDQSSAAGVNAAGHVVGLVSSDNAVDSHPVRWVDGVAEDLGDLGGGAGGALDINNHDVVVGWSMTEPGVSHGFRWQAGQIEDLDASLPKPDGSTVEDATRIDDDGRIVGTLALADGQRVGYLWDGTSVRELTTAPGDSIDLNDLGPDIVVGTSWGTSGSRAFEWRNGVPRELVPPAGDGCAAPTAVAGNGDVAGWTSLCGRSPSRAVLWRDGIPVDVQALIEPSLGIVARALFAADERGRVGGYGESKDVGNRPIVIDPTPRPTRVAGADAVETSLEEFRRLATGPRFGVVLAPVDAPADLAMASFLAARRGLPLLLTGRAGLDERVANALTSAPSFGSNVLVVGGTAVLSPAVDQGITALGLRPERVAGTDRYGTSAAVVGAAGGATTTFAVDSEDTTTAISAIPFATHRRASIVFTGPGHPAPDGARVLTASDREDVAAELTPHPIAPAVARFSRISDGAVGAVLAARAGSPLRWVEHVPASAVFLIGGTAVLG